MKHICSCEHKSGGFALIGFEISLKAIKIQIFIKIDSLSPSLQIKAGCTVSVKCGNFFFFFFLIYCSALKMQYMYQFCRHCLVNVDLKCAGSDFYY